MSVVLETLRSIFPDDVLSTELLLGQAVSRIRPGSLLKVAKLLKDDPRTRMEMLVDITALDRPEMPERFEVVYSFYSLSLNHRLRLKVSLSAGGGATSLSALWPIADWLEREVWDMFGIRFEGHPGLKRLFLYEEFVGHPLRKDYPLKKRQPLIGPAN